MKHEKPTPQDIAAKLTDPEAILTADERRVVEQSLKDLRFQLGRRSRGELVTIIIQQMAQLQRLEAQLKESNNA